MSIEKAQQLLSRIRVGRVTPLCLIDTTEPVVAWEVSVYLENDPAFRVGSVSRTGLTAQHALGSAVATLLAADGAERLVNAAQAAGEDDS